MSSKTNSIVEVNGNRYDALTGRLLNSRKSSPGKKVIDGFTLGAHNKQSNPGSKELARASLKAQGLHKRSQRSVTLMRRVVKKPMDIKKPATHSAPHARDLKTPNSRVARAKTVTRHARVERFGLLPKRRPETITEAQPKISVAAKANYRDSETAAPRLPSMVSSASHKKIEQLLDEALLKADAHKNMMRSRKKSYRLLKPLRRLPRWVNYTILVFLIAVFAFWLVWQNLPTVAMHVAAARSHVNAALPGYTPSGFGLASPINYKDGSVMLSYKEASSSQKFSLTQKASNWDSSSLANNYLPADQPVQTSMVNGTTVYIYGSKANAAWVNHGVLYDLKNNADLSSDQILKIVQGF